MEDEIHREDYLQRRRLAEEKADVRVLVSSPNLETVSDELIEKFAPAGSDINKMPYDQFCNIRDTLTKRARLVGGLDHTPAFFDSWYLTGTNGLVQYRNPHTFKDSAFEMLIVYSWNQSRPG